MDKSFDSARFVRNVGITLVSEFEKARSATTAELVASAMETAARRQLEQILPTGVAVGTGCVIDSYGNTSRQTDIVLYERDICPVFRVNYDDPKATYYPCEGVIAVGEIKSSIGKKELEDAFQKVASVKSLKRNFDHPKYPDLNGKKLFGYRKYGERTGALRNDLIKPVNYAPNNSEASKIYGFVLADTMRISADTMKGHYSRLVNEFDDLVCPNGTFFLEGTVFSPARPEDKTFKNSLSVEMGWCILMRRVSSPFSMLISSIHSAYNLGGTAEPDVFGQYYLQPKAEEIDLLDILPIKGKYIVLEDIYDNKDFPNLRCANCGRLVQYGGRARLINARQVSCADCAV